jgi:hypothetical protein
MTQTNGSFWIIWPQLLYSVPIILVAIAALVACIMNWQKAPTASMFCLIGFGLIGFNSVFGAVMTTLMIRNGGSTGMLWEIWSLVAAARVILNLAGYLFLLVAVFSGREGIVKPNLFQTTPGNPPNQ